MPDTVDILAIAAHRDDVEQTCGGTLLKMVERGYRTAILDLTQGEMGTRGSAEERAREAQQAATLLRVSWREALDIPDGRVENTWENRLKIARVLRELRPRVVILPYWQGRHPDHYTCSTLGYEACFLAGLGKLGQVQPRQTSASSTALREDAAPELEAIRNLAPHRPFKIVYASLYFDVRPSFVIDITDQFETRLRGAHGLSLAIRRPERGRRTLPDAGRNPPAHRGHGIVLRIAGRREVRRTLRAKRNRAGR